MPKFCLPTTPIQTAQIFFTCRGRATAGSFASASLTDTCRRPAALTRQSPQIVLPSGHLNGINALWAQNSSTVTIES